MQNQNSLLKKVFDSKIKMPTKGDWVSDINETLEELEIKNTFREIKVMSKNNLLTIVKLAIEKACIIIFDCHTHNKTKKGK